MGVQNMNPGAAANAGSGPASAADKRRSHRQKTLKSGHLILSDWTTMDCTVRDLSPEGAKLAFGGPTELPKTFSLVVHSTDKMIPAELLWQRGLSAGVAFTGPERPAPHKSSKPTSQ
jgi:hypothetical protein